MKKLPLILFLTFLSIPLICPAQKISPQQELTNLRNKYKAELSELADWCAENNLPQQEKITRDWAQDFPQDRVCLYEITTETGWNLVPEEQLNSPEKGALLKTWLRKFVQLRIRYSGELIALASENSVKGRATFAFEIRMLALRENPQNESIRKTLGYIKYKNRWATLFEINLIKKGMVNHDRFGWIPIAYVAKYEAGERFYNKQWMSSEEEARIRLEKNDPWIITTPYYVIRSYPSLEQGVELSRKLENLALIWNQLFLRFFATEKQIHALFAGRNTNFNTTPHRVYFYRNRQQYISEVTRIMKNSFVTNTLGVYYSESNAKSGTRGAAFFFAGEGYDERTMLHEATHQLFAEARRISFTPGKNINVPSQGKQANFWIVEGIATFMESLTDQPGRHELGSPSDDRLFAARYRALTNHFYVPLASFCKMNREQFQNDPNVPTFYSQAAGLTWFLLFYDDGKYRDCLVDYLSAVYSGTDSAQTLQTITGTPFAELDKEYMEYLNSTVQPSDRGASLDPISQ